MQTFLKQIEYKTININELEKFNFQLSYSSLDKISKFFSQNKGIVLSSFNRIYIIIGLIIGVKNICVFG